MASVLSRHGPDILDTGAFVLRPSEHHHVTPGFHSKSPALAASHQSIPGQRRLGAELCLRALLRKDRARRAKGVETGFMAACGDRIRRNPERRYGPVLTLFRTLRL